MVLKDLVDDALNGLGGSCIDTTDYNAYANRMWLPNEGDQSDTFGTCAACDAEPFVMTVDLSCYDGNNDGNPDEITSIKLTGQEFGGWDPTFAKEAINNGDGTWSYTFIEAPTIDFEYLWIVNDANEALVDDAVANLGLECVGNTDY